MSVEDTPSFVVSQRRLAFVLSLIAVLSFGWGAARYVLANEYTLREHSAYIQQDKEEKKQIIVELKQLNERVAELVGIWKAQRDLALFPDDPRQ